MNSIMIQILIEMLFKMYIKSKWGLILINIKFKSGQINKYSQFWIDFCDFYYYKSLIIG